MKTLNRCLECLEKNKILYSHSIHSRAQTDRATAEAERIPAHEFAKTVVYFGEKGFGMTVLPAHRFLDFGDLLRLLGLSHVRLASRAELAELFPLCELGAMPPFGNLFRMPVLLDGTVAGQEFIAFNAGTHQDVIRMSVPDFKRLVKPVVGSFSTGQYASTKVVCPI